ncbi:hypothetical protein ACFCX4_34800 [Kitasatospora sp. NPDC056327]|uniref:hypothetical protein n=1 Tax=Kitasatospora sp. NPDC056327 TaxID=3345785 RepID=UPI0035E12D71
MNRTTATVAAATFAAALLLVSCSTTTRAAPTHQPVFAPTAMPSLDGAEAGAAEFVRFTQEKGTPEQQAAVTGHVTGVARSAAQGDHRNSYIATDYPQPEEATMRAITDAYLAWAGPADDAAMLVLYTAAGTVMGGVELAALRSPAPASSSR